MDTIAYDNPLREGLRLERTADPCTVVPGFSGSRTYERIDQPAAGFIHTEWEELVKK